MALARERAIAPAVKMHVTSGTRIWNSLGHRNEAWDLSRFAANPGPAIAMPAAPAASFGPIHHSRSLSEKYL
jgi:hypothetical protein